MKIPLSVRAVFSKISLTALLLATTLAPVRAQNPPPTPPPGVRVFTCGHSFHFFVPDILKAVADAAGIQGHVQVGMSAIGGSTIQQHWDLKDDRFKAHALLTAGTVDVLTLSPIWMPDTGIDNFAALAFQHNPNIRILVQEFWMPNDTYNPVYPLDSHHPINHDATDFAALTKAQDAYDHDLTQYVEGINKKLGKQILFVVPVGYAVIRFREMMVRGQVPGLTIKSQNELFFDGWGHPRAEIQALDTYCNFACIYHRSPVGIPPVAISLRGKGKFPPSVVTLDPKLTTLLEQIAWDTVTHYPMSGVTAGLAQ